MTNQIWRNHQPTSRNFRLCWREYSCRLADLSVRLGSGTCCFLRTMCRHLCSALGHSRFAQRSAGYCSPFRAQQDLLSQFIYCHSQRPEQDLFLKSLPCTGPDSHRNLKQEESKEESVPVLRSLGLHLSGYFWDQRVMLGKVCLFSIRLLQVSSFQDSQLSSFSP